MNAPLPVSALAEVQRLSLPDEGSLSAGASAALRMAQTFTIATADDYALAADELKAVNAKLAQLEERRFSITRPLDAAKKAVMDLFRGPVTTLEAARDTFKRAMLAYTTDQERIAAEARRIAEEAAAAERARLAAEAAAKQKVADEEAARLTREAEAAAAAGNAEAAAAAEQQAAAVQHNAALDVAAIQNVASVVVAAPVVAAAPKVAGVSTAKTVDFEVTDLHALVRHVAENPALLNLLVPDSVRLRAYVRGLGLNTNLPGVRVFEKKSLRAA